jgi:hypothetical protein
VFVKELESSLLTACLKYHLESSRVRVRKITKKNHP